MPREQGFIYDAQELGLRFLGKVLKAREITAEEFDQARGATLAQKVGADALIFYLEIDNLEDPSGNTRATFFMPDKRPISKWGRFLRALSELKVSIRRRPDGTTDLEGKYLVFEEKELDMGKRGKTNTLEPVEIPSPEEIDALESARGRPVVEDTIAKADEIAITILSVADGLTSEQLTEQMKALGIAGWEKIFAELRGKQSILIDNDGKLKVA